MITIFACEKSFVFEHLALPYLQYRQWRITCVQFYMVNVMATLMVIGIALLYRNEPFHWYFKCKWGYIDSRSNNCLPHCWSFMYSPRKTYLPSCCFCIGNLLDDLWINNSLDSVGNYKVPGIVNIEKDYLAYDLKISQLATPPFCFLRESMRQNLC